MRRERLFGAPRFKLGALTVMPKAGGNSRSSSTQGLGSKKENFYMSWPEFQFDHDMHVYQNRWEVRKKQLVFMTYSDSLGEAIIYFYLSK